MSFFDSGYGRSGFTYQKTEPKGKYLDPKKRTLACGFCGRPKSEGSKPGACLDCSAERAERRRERMAKNKEEKDQEKDEKPFNPGWVNPSDPMGTDPNAPVGD